MFRRFCESEWSEMQLEAKMKDDYETIMKTLTDFLTTESSKLLSEIEKGRVKQLRGWDEVKAAANKVKTVAQDAHAHALPTRLCVIEDFAAKWTVRNDEA